MTGIPPIVMVRADQYDAVTGLALADGAVRGVRVDAALPPGPAPRLDRVSPFAEDYPQLVGDWVAEQVRILRAAQERHDRNLAMLLWGIHL